MPYKSNTDLPADVREGLPEEAQEIYRRAYNVACDPTRSSDEVDERASREAWQAVESEYELRDNSWERRNQDEQQESDRRGTQQGIKARGGENDGLEAEAKMEEEELRANPEAGEFSEQQTGSKAVRHSQPRDKKQWTPGASHTSPYSSSGGEKQAETPAPSHELDGP